ncbi:MAG: imidazole glycerol phosphate synthase subunit HisH [Gemmatales bacterium]|nr:imidazole glycerol phosphate synthase subunit HisH [Gemmatales bacterium]MDW7994670.1 imidazole glycerol phosphate synthase subunit HisH [Gemmatales bacterium]
MSTQSICCPTGMIVIVDYGMGNLRSVQKALEKLGHQATITSDPSLVRQAEKLILPGVGAFGDAMERLRHAQLVAPIRQHIEAGKPFLGICLGLQLLFERSYEGGVHEGLGVLAGEVVRFDPALGLKVPHMGWNRIVHDGRCPLFAGVPSGSYVYFVHSYYPRPIDRNIIAAETDYGNWFCSAVWRGLLFATQFHPEKSQSVGLRMLQNFATIA